MSETRCSVRILEPAQIELENIARLYLSLSGPESARRITDRIYAALEKLSEFPLSGPAMREPGLKEMGFRFIVADRFVAVYRPIGDRVVVYHIFDGRMDYPALFKAELDGR